MEMTNVTIKVPKEMEKYLHTDDQYTETERNAMLLFPYVKNETISNGRAAEILGISKWDLISFYDSEGLPYLDLDEEEIKEDLAAIKKARASE